jgi:cytochrome b561
MSPPITSVPQRFPGSMRFFHWVVALIVLTMLGIGVSMVASLSDYHRLLSIHRPLGIFLLILVALRYVNRRLSTLPPFPETMSPRERSAASASELALYTLLFLQPLVGWAMLSAARYPIVMFGSVHLFPILPHSLPLYAFLRRTHTILACLLFLIFLGHFGAVLFHTVVIRDGMLSRMLPAKTRMR